MIEVRHIEKYYGSDGITTKAIDDVSFVSADGEFLCIMGASGSGKTTLLNCVSTIDHVSAGEILYDGVPFDSLKQSELAAFRRCNLGFVFQNYNLLDSLTLGENISLSLVVNNAAPQSIPARIRQVAHAVGIEHRLDQFPRQVSGGERQRCAFARAIINSPKLIFADEPTGALDSSSAIKLMEIISTLNKTLRSNIIMVTHDAFYASYADRVLFLKDGKLFSEIVKGEKDKRDFYHEIVDSVSLLGGRSVC